MYDYDAMMAALNVSAKDGWEFEGWDSEPHYGTWKGDVPPERKLEGWFTFERYIKKSKKWESLEIPVKKGDYLKNEEHWCILTVGKDLANMRRGENEKFHDDGQWDDNFLPICSKRILKEHMEKYFDDQENAYCGTDNPRKVFKKMIYDKFEDGKGLCVVYC